MSDSVLKRVVRRETHSPRTVLTVCVLVIVVALAAYVGVEIVLALSGVGPLLVAPGVALAWLADLPQQGAPILIAAVAVGLVGLILVCLAIAPGRRASHRLDVSDHAVVADNEVIAAALVEHVRREMDLSQGAVTVGVGHRSVDVTVRPEPGHELDKTAVRSIVEAELAEYAASPGLRVHARVLHRGGRGGEG